MMKLLIISIFSLFMTSLYAQIATRVGLEGQGSLSGWSSQRPDRPQENNLKSQLRVDGWINITPDGCLKVRGRLTTGETLNNEWMNTGIGADKADFSLSLRQLYVSSSCLKNITIEAGANPVHNYGSLGLSGNGFVDGLQVIVLDEENGREWILSLGHVEAEAHLFDRQIDEINHANVQVRQKITENGSAFGSVSRYEETFFSRGGLRWVLSEYASWLQDSGAEILLSDERPIGTMIDARFVIKKWRTRIAVSKIDPNPLVSDKLAFQLKQFYGYGNNILLEASRDLPSSFVLNVRIRLGDAGQLGQIGISKRISLPKRK